MRGAKHAMKSRRARPGRLIVLAVIALGAAGVAAVGLGLVGGNGSSARDRARAQAALTLKRIPLPAGARVVRRVTGLGAADYETLAACSPGTQTHKAAAPLSVTRYWVVKGTMVSVEGFLQAHPVAGQALLASGRHGSAGHPGFWQDLTEATGPAASLPGQQGAQQVALQWAPAGPGLIGIRAEASVYPPGERPCPGLSSGSAALVGPP